MQRALGDHEADRTQDALPIDTRVAVEIGVLGGDEGALYLIGDLLDLDRYAPRLAEGGNELVVSAVDAHRHLQRDVAQCFDRGQARRDQPVGHAERDTAEDEAGDSQDQDVTEQTENKTHVIYCVWWGRRKRQL